MLVKNNDMTIKTWDIICDPVSLDEQEAQVMELRESCIKALWDVGFPDNLNHSEIYDKLKITFGDINAYLIDLNHERMGFFDKLKFRKEGLEMYANQSK